MKHLFLTLALLASFSSIYCMSDLTPEDKEECKNLQYALENYNYGIPYENCDPQRMSDINDIYCQYVSDNRNVIASLVNRMQHLITRYPNHPSTQGFMSSYNTMQALLAELIAAEQE